MASRQETFNDYEGFVEKFKPKKTTDDCYTPKEVYDVILEWAVERYGIDPSKIKADLGWYPETPFEEGIVKTIRWNLENRAWVEAVSGDDYQDYYEKMYGHR